MLELKWGMFPNMRKQSEALWVPWVGAESEAEAGGTSWGEGWWWQWCTSGCLPAPDTLILHYRLIFLLLCFQWCPWYQSSSSSSSLFSWLYHWAQLDAKEQHKIRGAWPTQDSFDFWFQEEAELDEKLPGISCLGAGKVVRDSKLNYEFSVSIKIPPR